MTIHTNPRDPAVEPRPYPGARSGNFPSAAELVQRARVLRRHCVRMIAAAGSGHPGGSLSAAEIVTTLFWSELRHDPTDPRSPDRDRFILSKGHGVPVLYAALAETGHIPREALSTLRKIGSVLQGHPSVKDLPIVEASTGSLGQGLSIGVGMALAARMQGRDYRVYVLMGDGEIEEGQVWEAAMSAAHLHLENLVGIIDRNGFQLDGPTEEIMGIEPLAGKWRAFGWHVIDVDGHDPAAIQSALNEARAVTGQPVLIIARTVKGRGVSFLEGNEYHGKAPSAEQAERALAELADPEEE